jgi:D-glycero-alpha-D-manno-heptose-7-phosphate kinase
MIILLCAEESHVSVIAATERIRKGEMSGVRRREVVLKDPGRAMVEHGGTLRDGSGRQTPFRVVAPNRVDLAGGTLDIYPLYLLVDGATTVNAAITVRSVVEVRPFRRGAFRLHSANYGETVLARDTHGVAPGGTLGLLARALRHYPAVSGVEIAVRNEAPVGSGLGASSALLVALMTAMGRLTGRPCRRNAVAATAMELEAAHLRGLTGRQDHVAALRGGILGIRFPPGELEIRRHPPAGAAARMLRSHGFLAYTGIAHRSSDANWRMIRGAIEGKRSPLAKFRGIAAAAQDAWSAVCAGDAAALGAAVRDEWRIRRTLAHGVSPRKVEALVADRRFRSLVSGTKLCGAGSGGALFGLLRDPGDRAVLEAILSAAGMKVFPFRISGGIRVAAVDGG